MIFLLLLLLPSNLSAREPSIQEVQTEAVRYLGFDQQELDGWKRHARWSAALPRLQVGFQRELRDLISLSTKDSVNVSGGDVFVGPSQNNFDQNFNQGTAIDVRAVWYLNELVFNRDSLASSSERRDWLRERSRVLEGVTEAYYTRQRSRQGRGEGPEKSTAMLDALTGGWFSQELAR